VSPVQDYSHQQLIGPGAQQQQPLVIARHIVHRLVTIHEVCESESAALANLESASQALVGLQSKGAGDNLGENGSLTNGSKSLLRSTGHPLAHGNAKLVARNLVRNELAKVLTSKSLEGQEGGTSEAADLFAWQHRHERRGRHARIVCAISERNESQIRYRLALYEDDIPPKRRGA
jgi:hypothetical protein